MNEFSNPQVAAEKARDTYRKTAVKFDEVATTRSSRGNASHGRE